MGNRQSAQQSSSQQQNDQTSSSNTDTQQQQQQQQQQALENRPVTRSQSAAMRPISRVQTQRTQIRSSVIPVNDNQRRDERRARRERIREAQQQQQEEAPPPPPNARSLLATVSAAMAALGANTNEQPAISPFSRMIATAITEAVVSSFRPSSATASSTTEGNRPELTLHLPPELFQQMEPGSQEDTFMRFMRLPVIVSNTPNLDGTTTTTTTTTTATTAAAEETATTTTPTTDGPVNANGEAPTLSSVNSEITRLLNVPLLLYGQRSDILATPPVPPSTTTSESTSTIGTNPQQPELPSSQQQQQQQQQPSVTGGQWTLYIISGGSVEGLMSDTNSYEELLELVTLLGPARRPTVSQEAIDNHVPIVKYSESVKNSILGNAEKCQVCLNDYVLQEDLRVLGCHHGFHSSCIDTWLTGGQNKCPLCRDVPVPMSNDEN